MSGRLPRDTPLDTPAVSEPGSLVKAPDLGPDAESVGARALSRARAVETLEVAYEAWAELRREYAAAQRRWKEEREHLSQQGGLLLGAVKYAGAAPPAPAGTDAALVPPSALEGFLAEARQKLEQAHAALEHQIASADSTYRAALAQLRTELRDRVARHATVVKPAFRIAVRVLPGERRILHAHRLGHDEAVVALYALTRRIPSRYDYLFDDSTDDVGGAPGVLYAEEGVTEVRPPAAALAALLLSQGEVWPVKAMLPLTFPDGGWMRWVARGAVLEAEVADGEAFRNVLSAAEAERVTGLLLAHKLAGRIELELVRD